MLGSALIRAGDLMKRDVEEKEAHLKFHKDTNGDPHVILKAQERLKVSEVNYAEFDKHCRWFFTLEGWQEELVTDLCKAKEELHQAKLKIHELEVENKRFKANKHPIT